MDLQRVYEIVTQEQEELERFFELLRGSVPIFDGKLAEYEYMVEDFLAFVGLQKSPETMLAAINRIVHLREDLLLQVISDFDEDLRIQMKERAFVWVSEFYLARFEQLLERLEKEGVLSPFYLALMRHVHRIGEVFSSWQSSWMAQIIYGVNRELLRLFNADEEKIFEMLTAKGLLDRGHEGKIADRCYSVLRILPDGSYERLPYALAFKEEVRLAAKRLDEAIGELELLEDEVYGQKEQWLDYLRKIQEALLEEDIDRLVVRWADVDRAWMQITTPLQVGHPLEYYEDRFRKAVALEWDLRIADPSHKGVERISKIEAAFKKIYLDVGIESEEVFETTLANLAKTQLYIGRPMLFYGSEFNGLFSAQVVPNDEVVSKECGKKIFAYADMVLQMQRSKPKMQLPQEIYGKELYERFRRILQKPDLWHKIYEISTIGHEYGHILWMGANTEVAMNVSGQFKNLEEFKATCGGLVSYFLFDDDRLWEELLYDTLTRAVSLIAWREVDEVLPYYVEGLLHLKGLFESGIFSFDGKLSLHLDFASYTKLKEWYIRTYTELARHYLLQRDSKEFLERFVDTKEYLPKDEEVRSFVEYYYQRYKEIGAKVA